MAADSVLLCDPADKAAREAANGVRQLEYIDELVSERGATDLRESHVRTRASSPLMVSREKKRSDTAEGIGVLLNHVAGVSDGAPVRDAR